MTVHETAAAGFANTADDYERSRPSYPPAAVDHLVQTLGLGPGRTVCDVAAGTGKLTRLLVASGAQVIAVEPVSEMRAIIERVAPSVVVVAGSAEDLPVAAADAITVAQAFHWFDGTAALASFHRVLPPGGGLAVIYNERDLAPGWVAEVYELIRPYRTRVPQREDGHWADAFADAELFTPLERLEFDNPHELSRADAIGRFRSLSYVGALDPAAQRVVLGEITALIDSHPDTRGMDPIVLPQRTVVSTCRRR